jgi:hypothetical protein
MPKTVCCSDLQKSQLRASFGYWYGMFYSFSYYFSWENVTA